MNVSASINVFRLIANPSLCLPQATIPNFNQLPVPVSSVFPQSEKGEQADIRAVVLDKDNCFAKPKTNTVWPEYEAKFQSLRKAYPASLLVVSNSSGTTQSDPTGSAASILTSNTGVPVLRHSVKKPGCSADIMAYFSAHPESGVTHPSQVAVVGDRLATDVLMANMAGMRGVWVRDGVVQPTGWEGLWTRAEKGAARWLMGRGYVAPTVTSPFEE